MQIKIKKIIFNILFCCFLLGFIFSSYKIIKYYIEQTKISRQLEIINDSINIKEITENVEIIDNEEENKNNPYWDYINMNLIDVDINKLKSINKDVKGWIQVGGTNINYPFVQAKDNSYYLNHAFDKSYNIAGWVFLDYRNNLSSFNDKNTIIYAHGMKNQTMFGTLLNVLNKKWLNNKDNYVVKISNEYEDTLWQVFSVYKIPNTNDYIKIDFSSNDEFKNFISTISSRSIYIFNTNVSKDDRILTLSTCYDDNNKVVLHAKLIKRKVKSTSN